LSKTSLIINMAENLRSLADSVQAIAETIASNESAEVVQLAATTPAKEAESVAKKITLEEVRAALGEKSQQGFTAGVRALLEKYGAPKLSQIDPANYAALLADAEGLK